MDRRRSSSGRFVGVVRPLAPFLAGASRYPGGRFAVVALLGTAMWSAACVVLGFLLWNSFDQAIAIAQQGTIVVGIAALVVAGGSGGPPSSPGGEAMTVWLLFALALVGTSSTRLRR